MQNRFYLSNPVVFFLFLVAGGLLSVILKFEHLWDFANYHYYNPWAFLNNRVNYDVAVAGMNAFYSPFADFPLYYLITYFNDYPNLIYFVQGLWFGALGFVLFKVSELFFADKRAVLFTLLLGLSGYAVFFQIGTASNEIMIAFIRFVFAFENFLRKNRSKSEPFFYRRIACRFCHGAEVDSGYLLCADGDLFNLVL